MFFSFFTGSSATQEVREQVRKISENYDMTTPKGQCRYLLDATKSICGQHYKGLVAEKLECYMSELEACKQPNAHFLYHIFVMTFLSIHM